MTSDQKISKSVHIVLWLAQALLAAAFGLAGAMKLSMPIEQLAANGMTFADNFSPLFVRFIGFCELIGAMGLILPSALRIRPILTSVAALGIAIIMVLAAAYHVMHHEPFLPTVVLLAIALFVAWGRFKNTAIKGT